MEEELKKLLEENLKLTQEIHGMVGQIRRIMMYQRIVSVIYLVIILAPLIFAIIYLPPLIKPYLDQYNQILNDFAPSASGSSTTIDPNLYQMFRQLQAPAQK